MKANHNKTPVNIEYLKVVVNISKSKNESKSQPLLTKKIIFVGCGKYQ